MTTAPALLYHTVGQLTDVQKERIRQFVAALRSGRYTQGHGWLAVITGSGDEAASSHCCLGVACFEAMRMGCTLTATPLPAPGAVRLRFGTTVRLRFADMAVSEDNSTTTLPIVVSRFYGFRVGSPELFLPLALREKYRDRVGDLDKRVFGAIELNDQFHMSFGEIADCFEYTYLREDWQATHAGD